MVMGVAGSGKTTVGTMLADAMHCVFLEGDSLHSAAVPLLASAVAWSLGSARLSVSLLRSSSGLRSSSPST